MFIMSTVYVWTLIGPMCLIGLLIILMFYPIMASHLTKMKRKVSNCSGFQGGVATLTSKIRGSVVPITDRRVSQMNELLNAIKLVKMCAWESSFEERVKALRVREVKQLRKAAFLQSVSMSITPSITVVAAVVTCLALT